MASQPRMIVFEDRNFGGDHLEVTISYDHLNEDWNDKISSIKVLSGSFEFYGAANYGTEDWGPIRLEVGEYDWVADHGIRNDTISSWKAFDGPDVPSGGGSGGSGGDGGSGGGGIPVPLEKPIDFVKTYTLVDGNDAACGARGRTWFTNSHPLRAILVHYSVSPTESRSLTVIPKIQNNNKDTAAGCGQASITSAEFV